ncbi:MAG: hypothetical protein QM296_10385 [Bacillota bacterium]|nr:hypothetical protein [Bacillota bacterium]
MKAFIKLHLKEYVGGKSFILFGILGGLVTLILFTAGEVSFANNPTEEIISQFGSQWKFLSIMAGFAAVVISMGTIEKHRREKRAELLLVHRLGLERQMLGLAIGNALVSMLLAAVLAVVLIFVVIFAGAPTSLIGFIAAFLSYLLTAGMLALMVSVLNVFLPSIVVAVLGVLLVIVGSFHQTIQGMLLNNGQTMGRILAKIMNLLPPLDVFNRLTRSLFFLEFRGGPDLLVFLIHLWLTLTVVCLTAKRAGRHEKI